MRKNAEEVAVEERRALIGSPDAIHKQQKIEREGDLAGASESVTASLQRTRQQMTQVTPTFIPSTLQPHLNVVLTNSRVRIQQHWTCKTEADFT